MGKRFSRLHQEFTALNYDNNVIKCIKTKTHLLAVFIFIAKLIIC